MPSLTPSVIHITQSRQIVRVISAGRQGLPGPPGPAAEGLDPDQQAALDAANAPSATNPFLTEEDLPPVVDLSGKEDVGVAAGLVASHASTRHLTEAQETVLNGLQTALDSKLPKTGGQLTDVRESIAYEELTANKTISFAAADVLYFFINPSGSSVQLTMPADPGSLSKSGVIWVKNNTGKAHTWNTSPAIRFVSETDADTVPTPAAVGYWTRYTAQWHDNNGGAGFWAVALAGRDTA